MFDARLLPLLRCPLTLQPLTIAPPALLAGVVDLEGHPVEAALLRADGAALYLIRGGIPVLLAEAAVPVVRSSQGASF